jgi:hypothetical protein
MSWRMRSSSATASTNVTRMLASTPPGNSSSRSCWMESASASAAPAC